MNIAPLPDPEHLTRKLRTALPEFVCVQWLAETTSTNAQLLTQAKQTSNQTSTRPSLLGAHLQQQGRGRAGRTWQNRPGATLMFSCAFDVQLGERLPVLSPLAGVAAVEALRHWISPALRSHLCLKWPNDVQWRDAKLAGILVETSGSCVVMGLGLNLMDAPILSQMLRRPIADWHGVVQEDACAAQLAPVQMVACIARAWQTMLAQDEVIWDDSLKDFPQRFAAVDALHGRAVDVLDQGRVIQSGVAGGVDAGGRLLLWRQGAAKPWPVTVGEVSVRAQTKWAGSS